MHYLVRSAALTNFLETARSLGLAPYQLLQDAGIERNALLDPDLRIPVEGVARLLETAAALAPAEDFGLRMAQSRRISNLGPLGLIVREQPTLRSAFEAITRHIRLHNEALALQVEERDGIVIASQSVIGAHHGPIRQATELVVGVMFRTLQSLLGASWKPLKVCFSHRAPRALAAHQRFFGVPLEFGGDFDGIVCRARDLDLPMPSADPQMVKYVDQYIASLAGDASADPRDRVRQLVTALLPSGRCTADVVAQQLGIDRRTVHRHLSRHGESFNAIVDAVRVEMATRFLSSPGRSATDVALMLGFSAPSAFSRWFTGRFGCSVSAWRARQAGQIIGAQAKVSPL